MDAEYERKDREPDEPEDPAARLAFLCGLDALF
jgi:hypothetical protein